MEVFETEKYYIFVNKGKSLWWSRQTSEFSIKCGKIKIFLFVLFLYLKLNFFYHLGWDLSSVDDIECIGITYGIIGEIKFPGIYDPHLLIIKDAAPLGVLYGKDLVYKIKSVIILSSDEPDGVLTQCF